MRNGAGRSDSQTAAYVTDVEITVIVLDLIASALNWTDMLRGRGADCRFHFKVRSQKRKWLKGVRSSNSNCKLVEEFTDNGARVDKVEGGATNNRIVVMMTESK
jgi:hypothetical protein